MEMNKNTEQTLKEFNVSMERLLKDKVLSNETKLILLNLSRRFNKSLTY